LHRQNDHSAATDRWLSIEELSERLSVPIDTLRYWRVRKVGPPAAKLTPGTSGMIRYWLPDVEAWEEERRSGRVAS
jgi:MerR HTH family regulatory protein